MKEIKGNYSGKGKKIAIIISKFNDLISGQLLSGCVDTLTKAEVKKEDISVIWSPGSFEIPQVLAKLDSKKIDAVITLGAVIRGDTPHFDFIAAETAKGIAQVSIAKGLPVVFGIITADTVEQALDRAGLKQGNKGKDAALSALELINIYKQL